MASDGELVNSRLRVFHNFAPYMAMLFALILILWELMWIWLVCLVLWSWIRLLQVKRSANC